VVAAKVDERRKGRTRQQGTVRGRGREGRDVEEERREREREDEDLVNSGDGGIPSDLVVPHLLPEVRGGELQRQHDFTSTHKSREGGT